MPPDRIATTLARIATALPSAYAVRTDRLIDTQSANLVVIERDSAKPLNVRLPHDREASQAAAHYLSYRGGVTLAKAWLLIDEFRSLASYNPAGAWPLRTHPRRPLDIEPASTTHTPKDARSAALAAVAPWIPKDITQILSHELRVMGPGKRLVKRHFVSFQDTNGECASLSWTMAAAHALYRLTDEGVEPEANRWRLACWARQLNLDIDALINLLIALHTPLTLLGVTRIRR